MRTVFELLLIAAVVWFIFEKMNPQASTASGTVVAFNENPGQPGSFLNENAPAPTGAPGVRGGGCGCGG